MKPDVPTHDIDACMHVSQMCGVPETILLRAREVLSAQQYQHQDLSNDIVKELCEMDLSSKAWKTSAISLVKKLGLIKKT